MAPQVYEFRKPAVPAGATALHGAAAESNNGIALFPVLTASPYEPTAQEEPKWCCVTKPVLNVKERFRCRDTIFGYTKDSREEERTYTKPIGISLPRAADPRFPPEDYRKERPEGTGAEGGRRFSFEAYSKLDLKGKCDCTVRQFVDIQEANAAFLKDLKGFFDDRHARDLARYEREKAAYERGETRERPREPANPGYDPARGPLVGGPEYEDYIHAWVQCCTGKDADPEDQAFLSFVDAPGPFDKQAKGVLGFRILFESGALRSRGETCACLIWELKFELRMDGGTIDHVDVEGSPRCIQPNAGGTRGREPG